MLLCQKDNTKKSQKIFLSNWQKALKIAIFRAFQGLKNIKKNYKIINKSIDFYNLKCYNNIEVKRKGALLYEYYKKTKTKEGTKRRQKEKEKIKKNLIKLSNDFWNECEKDLQNQK